MGAPLATASSRRPPSHRGTAGSRGLPLSPPEGPSSNASRMPPTTALAARPEGAPHHAIAQHQNRGCPRLSRPRRRRRWRLGEQRHGGPGRLRHQSEQHRRAAARVRRPRRVSASTRPPSRRSPTPTVGTRVSGIPRLRRVGRVRREHGPTPQVGKVTSAALPVPDVRRRSAPSVLEQVSARTGRAAGEHDHVLLRKRQRDGRVTASPPRRMNRGCEASDFAGFPAGNIALIRDAGRTCSFAMKATNRYDAGAVGIVIYNNVDGRASTGRWATTFTARLARRGHHAGDRSAASRNRGPRPAPEDRHLARHRDDVQRAGRAAGQERRTTSSWRALTSTRSTRAGHQRQRQRVGRSARGGREPRRRSSRRTPIRFAWWGAEESNLVGSTNYVNGLTPGRAGQDRALPQLRHDRVAEPRLLHL